MEGKFDAAPPSQLEGQKAGVVAYRLAPQASYEILIITARQHHDSWIFPVGTVDPGETLEQAAARECMEESGYMVETGPLLKVIELKGKRKTNRFSFFAAQVTGEVAEYETDRQRRWIPLSELTDTVAEAFSSVAQSAVKYLSS